MYKLKLFEDFEEGKSFISIDPNDIDNDYKTGDYLLGVEKVVNLLKKKLGNNFTVMNLGQDIFICSITKPFLWKISALEDDYYLIKRSFLLHNISSTEMWFKCDDIRGIIKLIDPSYDFHTLYKQSDIEIWHEAGARDNNIKGSRWINMPEFLSSTRFSRSDIEKLNYYLNKESYPMNDIQDMLNTLKSEIKLKVSKATLYEIPKEVIGNGITDSGYEVFKITSEEMSEMNMADEVAEDEIMADDWVDDDKFVIIFYYYIKAFNIFCVLSTNKNIKTYACWDIKGLKSLLNSI